MRELQWYKHQKEFILNNEQLTDKLKSAELSMLLSDMTSLFEIPLKYGNEYRKKNGEAVKVYESIADAIGKLNAIKE